MKTIIATIDKRTGGITIKVEGVVGSDCKEFSRKFEEGLGIKDPERTLTDEFYQTNQQQQQQGNQ